MSSIGSVSVRVGAISIRAIEESRVSLSRPLAIAVGAEGAGIGAVGSIVCAGIGIVRGAIAIGGAA